MSTPTVAFLGAGTMGAPMAANLAAAGYPVRLWNRTREKAEAVDGADAAGSPREAADGADLTITMLSDGDAVEAAMAGADGALAAIGGDQPWVQMSTVGIEATERFATLAGEASVPFADVPVSGTKQPAEQGELVVLASGPEETLDEIAPLLDVLGQKTIRCGEAGGGTRLKLVLNSWLVGLVEALAETIAFAEAIGSDPHQFLDAIEGGPLGPAYARLKGEAMIGGSFEPSFALRLALKDVRLVEQAAHRHDIELPLIEAVERQMERAVDAGHGDEDMAATYLASAAT